VNDAQNGSTDAQNLFGVSFFEVVALTVSTGGNSSIEESVAGFCEVN
jgi:hypothetical protein